LRILTHAVSETDEFLVAFGCRADDDEQALRIVLEPACTWMPSAQK
jgi:hypothetical protein